MKVELLDIGTCNWKKVVQNRDSWMKVVEQARTLYRLQRFIRRRRRRRRETISISTILMCAENGSAASTPILYLRHLQFKVQLSECLYRLKIAVVFLGPSS